MIIININEEKIEAFLNEEGKKSEILKKLKELEIPYEVKIFLDIPYLFDGESEPRYEERSYLVYTPSANLASRAAASANLASRAAASAKIFSNSEERLLSNFENRLKALGLEENQYINGVKKGLIARGFTGNKLVEAIKRLNKA